MNYLPIEKSAELFKGDHHSDFYKLRDFSQSPYLHIYYP